MCFRSLIILHIRGLCALFLIWYSFIPGLFKINYSFLLTLDLKVVSLMSFNTLYSIVLGAVLGVTVQS